MQHANARDVPGMLREMLQDFVNKAMALADSK
jgi:hypothetical protein